MLLGHWGNEDQAWGLPVGAAQVSVAGDLLRCVEASVVAQDLVSSSECLSLDW